jgi:hypothetical protein
MEKINMEYHTIVVAGATGHLGKKICSHLENDGAKVRALVRKQSDPASVRALQEMGVEVMEINFNDHLQLTAACRGGSCLVSAVSGLKEVMIDLQTQLLSAAIEAGIPRFIPSDYCIDYTKLPEGNNRNLELRREFSKVLLRSPIAATSVLNGMFTDLLLKEAPVVLFKINRVMYWGSKEQLLDFTTMDNTAEYTARAALDNSTPRYLRIAGDVVNAKGLRDAATAATGNKFHLLRPGGLGLFKGLIKITKTLSPGKEEIFPAWQGMQYMHDMYTGLPKLEPLDNDRYDMKWTSVKEVLEGFKN